MPMRNRPQVYVVANGYLLSMFYSNRNDNSERDVFKKHKNKPCTVHSKFFLAKSYHPHS